MRKIILLIVLSINCLNAKIPLDDLKGSFFDFYPNVNYSPLLGVATVLKLDINNDLDDPNNKFVKLFFYLIPSEKYVKPTQYNHGIVQSLTPEIMGKLLSCLETNSSWNNFLIDSGEKWFQRHKTFGEGSNIKKSKFFKNIGNFKTEYDKFCINEENKQKARNYFGALLYLQGASEKDVKEYLENLSIEKKDFLPEHSRFLEKYEETIFNELNKSPYTDVLLLQSTVWGTSICVEVVIANIINVILYNLDSEILDLNYLSKNVQENIIPEFKKFLLKYNSIKQILSGEYLEDLVKLLSNVKNVSYLKEKIIEKNKYLFEIDSMLSNIFFIFKYLFNINCTSFNDFGQLISNLNDNFKIEISTEVFFYEDQQNPNVFDKIDQLNIKITKNDQEIFSKVKLSCDHAYFVLEEENIDENDDQKVIEISKLQDSLLNKNILKKEVLDYIYYLFSL